MSAGPSAAMTRALRIMAGLTVASGALQMVQPGRVLGRLSHDRAPLAQHLFGTIGMFMVVSGGTLRRSLAPPVPDRGLLVWAALQKLGASTAVGIGVRHRLFSQRALLVAAFDLASGLGCLIYAQQLARAATGGERLGAVTVRTPG
jgi:hypothetical protein